jgi:hypothetical protein
VDPLPQHFVQNVCGLKDKCKRKKSKQMWPAMWNRHGYVNPGRIFFCKLQNKPVLLLLNEMISK